METLNISVPEPVKAWIDAEVASGAYTTASDCIAALVLEAQKRKAREKVDALLLEGLNSGEPTPMTSQDWADLRQGLRNRVTKRTRLMSSHILKSRQALRDLAHLSSVIAADRPSAAERFLKATEKAFETLAGMPEMGSVWETPNPALSGLRFWSIRRFKKYLIFYRPTEEGIEVLRVLHSARDLKHIFDPQDQ